MDKYYSTKFKKHQVFKLKILIINIDYAIIIKAFTKNNNEKTLLASDYYHPYSKTSKILNIPNLQIKNISTDEYSKLLNQKITKISNTLNNYNGFEEIITETLAQIILKNKNKKTLNLDNTTTFIYQDPQTLPDIKIGAKFIKDMGPKMIVWFLTSAYNDYYYDYLEDIFQDKYEDLIIDFNDIYESTINEKDINPYSINDINEITKEKIYNKKR